MFRRMSTELPLALLCPISSNNKRMLILVEDPVKIKGVTDFCQQILSNKEVADKNTGLM